MAKKGLYKGYSSFEFQTSKTFSLNDIELVKMDLLNHIFTQRGERVAMSDFGTSIPSIIFEPLDDETVDLVTSDLQEVFDFDPRVEVGTLRVQPDFDNNSIRVDAELYYIELQITDNFELNIVFEE